MQPQSYCDLYEQHEADALSVPCQYTCGHVNAFSDMAACCLLPVPGPEAELQRASTRGCAAAPVPLEKRGVHRMRDWRGAQYCQGTVMWGLQGRIVVVHFVAVHGYGT